MHDVFQAISDPIRRDILTTLLEAKKEGVNELSVSDLVTYLNQPQPAISKHLKSLREAEAVSVREDGQRRLYSLNVEPLTMVEDFLLPFMLSDVQTEVSVQLIDEPLEDNDILPDSAIVLAQNAGRAAGKATRQVKQLVAKFRIG